MREALTADGYAPTKEKLINLQTRLAAIERRTDLTPEHMASVRRSYKIMISQFERELEDSKGPK